MGTAYGFLPELFLRAPYDSFTTYDLDHLPEVLSTEVFRNALWLASPEFFRLLEAKDFDYGRLSEKEKLTLHKYYNRMCFRPTPFGSFASFTLLSWADGKTLRLSGDQQSLLHLLPDEKLRKGVRGLNANTTLQLNPTLYQLGRSYRYVQAKPDENGKYRFALEALPAEKYYRQLITLFRKRPLTSSALTDWICRNFACSAAEAQEHLEFMIAAGLLFTPAAGNLIVPDKITAPSPAADLAFNDAGFYSGPLAAAPSLPLLAARLEHADFLREMPADRQHFYAALERGHLDGGPAVSHQQELKEVVSALAQLSVPRQPSALKQFIADFQERFNLQKVPLLLALDPDAGISYAGLAADKQASELLKELRFPEKQQAGTQLDWTAAHRLLFKLWTEGRMRDRFAPLQLNDEDLAAMETDTSSDHLPATLSLMYRDTAAGLLVEHAGGATATALVGRFSAFSEPVLALCRKLAAAEAAANPGILFADIGQLSDTHVDNINRRKRIYPHEIPLNVFSPLDAPAKLLPSDLLLWVRNGELILESVSLGKRVVPRLPTAYNYQHSESALFRLLCDLQYQGLRAGLTFALESYFPGMDFYPRVTYQRTILCPAKWVIGKPALDHLRAAAASDQQVAIRDLRDAQHLPQYVSSGSGDQQLVFDLSNAAELAFFFEYISKLSQLILSEYLLSNRSVKTGNKPLAAQFIAFLSHDLKGYEGIGEKEPKMPKAVSREYLLGSKWLYLKIYCNPQTVDFLLAGTISPLVRKHSRQILSWYFIRYTDKSHHLRLRIRLKNNDPGVILADLAARLEAGEHEKVIRDYQGAVYRRELERYGPQVMELAEELFHQGSELVLALIRLQQKGNTSLSEFELGLVTAYRMILRFLGDAGELVAFAGQMKDSFTTEFSGDKQLRIDMDRQYRSIEPKLSALIGAGLVFANLPPVMIRQLKRIEKPLLLIREKVAGEEPGLKLRLLSDLVHVQMNRTFSMNQRKQEFLVYYYLHKYCLSSLQRKGKGL
ncbi:lantibiotic dehydratase [Mucilaginibacter sp.]|uniref:lantibiotic dehydratase n=1 Tax=Mucilaginibacter sp. TaxID=1882438 RepID=UPI003D10BB3E